jgi:hypothetical protein
MDRKAVELGYREQLHQIQHEIHGLKTQLVRETQERRAGTSRRIADLERQHQDAGHRLDALRDAGYHAVSEVKAGIDMALDDLRHGLDRARHAVTGSQREG